jgi:fatty acid desaturase
MNNAPISKEELKPFLQRSDLKALLITAQVWISIVLTFALGVLFPVWPVYVLMVFLLAGRMQALAALMHEAGHKTFFKTKKYNAFVGNWLTSPFILLNGATYAKSHNIHHKCAGTENDPDLANYRNYPITKISLARKLGRDLIGITGLKMIAYMLLTGRDQLSKEKRKDFTLAKGLLLNSGIFGALWLLGHGELFALWVIAHFTVYLMIIRCRQIAEHAGVVDLFANEPKYNTRSVPQGILGALFFSPTQGLSYHCEHHLFMAVPTYHLKALHTLLKERGYYSDVRLAKGYLDLFPEIIKY